MKNFMPEADPKDRLGILINSADHIEETTYYKDLDEQDLDVKRETFVSNSIEIAKFDAVLAQAKALHKFETKPIKETNETLLQEIHTRKATVTGKLFHCADYTENIMVTYDENGEFISSRRLRPDEKQATIFSLQAKTAE